jgi:exodeoxyribonuclease V alpha subunit
MQDVVYMGQYITDDIAHACALTIHKSQRSGYPTVVIPLTLSHSNMLRRRLLYTAVTRGKDKVVLDVEALKLD